MSQATLKVRLTRVICLAAVVLVTALVAHRFAAVRSAEAKEEVSVLQNYTRNVAIVVYEGVELLDFAGPGEVFAAAANEGADRGRTAFKVYTVAPERKPVKSQDFVTLQPEYGVDDAPPPDILVIPGGSSGTLLHNERFMTWARAVMNKAKLTVTVCTGAFVPASAGLLDGHGVTTHHSAFDRLRAAAPKATVIEGKRFVDNGTIITTAGVSAGIDGSLHAVARLLGRHVADSTARYMEYHWTPEAYLATSYPYLNPSLDDHGRALQQASVHESAKEWSDAERVYRALVEKNPRNGFAWVGLSGVLQAKGEWDAAITAGERAATFGNVRSDALFTMACAYARKGNKDEAFDKLRLAVTAGFKRKWQIEGEADLAGLRGDERYRQLLAAL